MSKGTTRHLKLTKGAVERATPMANGRQRVHFDTALNGFGVVVGRRTKLFFAQRSVRGRNVRVSIGRFPEWSVDRARRQAQVELGVMGQGLNPNEVRRAELARVTSLGDAFALFMSAPKKGGRERSPRTLEGYRWIFKKYFSNWRDVPLTELTRPAVRDRHLEIGARHGPYAANGAMRLFRAVYNRARRQHPDLPTNPADKDGNVDYYEEKPRKAALEPEELPAWHAEVQAMANPIRRDYLIFVLFTGLRRESAAVVRWEHVDLDAATLLVPEPKGGEVRAFELPLSKHVVKLLRRRRAGSAPFFPDSPWAFPARSASGHIAEPKGNRNEFSVKFTVHGLRHTYLSAAVKAKVHPYVMKLLVNHALPTGDVTEGYVELTTEDLRPEQEKVTKRLLAQIKAK